MKRSKQASPPGPNLAGLLHQHHFWRMIFQSESAAQEAGIRVYQPIWGFQIQKAEEEKGKINHCIERNPVHEASDTGNLNRGECKVIRACPE